VPLYGHLELVVVTQIAIECCKNTTDQ